MGVWPAARADFEAVMTLLRDARAWQRASGFPVWREIDRGEIAAAISDGQVYVARAQGTVQGTVTLVEADQPLVWGAGELPALHLHRLASSASGAGALLIRWARCLAAWRCRKRLRLETWRENRALRAYYERQGFRHVRDRYFPPDSPAPADYRGTVKSLYQLEL